MNGWKVSRDPAQGALCCFRFLGMARLDRMDHTMVPLQGGEEGPEPRWADVAAEALRPSLSCQLRAYSPAKMPSRGKNL